MQFLYRLREFPLLIILILLCMGITVGYYTPIISSHILIITTCIIIFFLLLLKQLSSLSAPIIFFIIFLTGFGIIQHRLIIPKFNADSTYNIKGRLLNYPVQKDKYTKFIIKTENKGKIPSRLLVYIFSQDSIKLVKGDIIALKGKIKAIESKEHDSFNFTHYMKRQYVQYSCFVSENNFRFIKSKSFFTWASNIRYKIKRSLKKSGLNEAELGLLNAMLLGMKDNLNTELKQNYIDAGVIHILAISGLHTGIIFILIAFILKSILRINKTSIWFIILSSFFLGVYTVITGMSPSVLRASIILCFILIGKYIGRQIIIYNTIIASAILILIFDPATLFSPGFQLSYTAYTSIMYIYPKLYSLFHFNNKICDNIWKLALVSISAQIGTIPLSIFYFHHIYYYSLLTNICISVFIPFIIYGGIIIVLIAPFTNGSNIVTYIVNTIIKIVNKIIDIIAHLPGSISTYFNIGIFETILIYAIFFCSFAMLWYKKRKMIFVILISFLLLFSYQSYKNISTLYKPFSQ